MTQILNNKIDEKNIQNNRLWLRDFRDERLSFRAVCIELIPIGSKQFKATFASVYNDRTNKQIDHFNVLLSRATVEYFKVKLYNIYKFTGEIYAYKHAHYAQLEIDAMTKHIPVLSDAYSVQNLNKFERLEKLEERELSQYIKNRIVEIVKHNPNRTIQELTELYTNMPNNGIREYIINQQIVIHDDTAIDSFINADSFIQKCN